MKSTQKQSSLNRGVSSGPSFRAARTHDGSLPRELCESTMVPGQSGSAGGRRGGAANGNGVRSRLAVWVAWCLAVAAMTGGRIALAAEAEAEAEAKAAAAGSAGARVNTALVPSPGGSDTWRARNKAMNERAKKGHVDLIYIGDSIVASLKWDGEPVWDYYYAKRNGLVLGLTGDRTEQVLWRLENGNVDGISPKLAIVMIGQNNGPFNTGEEIGAGVTAVVRTLRRKLPDTKILVLAIFPRGEKPTKEREVLAKANEIASKLADGKRVFYMDVNHLFLRPDGSIPASLMPDFEHPNEEGHRVWAAALEPKVAELMGDTPLPEMPSRSKAP